MCGIRPTDRTWLREENERNLAGTGRGFREGRLSELSVGQSVNSGQCTQLHNGDGVEADAVLSCWILDYFKGFPETFTGTCTIKMQNSQTSRFLVACRLGPSANFAGRQSLKLFSFSSFDKQRSGGVGRRVDRGVKMQRAWPGSA